MSVLVIEDTFIDGTNVTVTAVVEDMRLLYRASRFEPEEWCPALARQLSQWIQMNKSLLMKMGSVLILIHSILTGNSSTPLTAL